MKVVFILWSTNSKVPEILFLIPHCCCQWVTMHLIESLSKRRELCFASVCEIVNRINQKVLNRFRWHFQWMLVKAQGRSGLICLRIQLWQDVHPGYFWKDLLTFQEWLIFHIFAHNSMSSQQRLITFFWEMLVMTWEKSIWFRWWSKSKCGWRTFFFVHVNRAG